MGQKPDETGAYPISFRKQRRICCPGPGRMAQPAGARVVTGKTGAGGPETSGMEGRGYPSGPETQGYLPPGMSGG